MWLSHIPQHYFHILAEKKKTFLPNCMNVDLGTINHHNELK